MVGARATWSTIYLAALPLLLAAAVLRVSFLPEDADEYLAHTITRPPGYPIFLDLMRLLFRGHFATPTAIVQQLIGFGAAFTLSRTLRDRLGLGRARVIVFYVLLFPQLQFGPIIGADSLSYSLFLFTCSELVESCFSGSTKRLLRTVAFAVLTVLVRTQFLFVYPILALRLGAEVLRERSRRTVTVLALAAAMVVGGVVVHKSYNLLVNGRFITSPYTGIQLLTMVLYVSNPQDVERVPDPADRAFLNGVLVPAQAREHTLDRKPFGMPTSLHLYEHYNGIAWDLIAANYARERTNHGFERKLQARNFTADELIAMDRYTVHLSLSLLKHVYRRSVVLLAKLIYQAAGAFGIFSGILLVLAVVRLWQTRAAEWAALILVILLWLANNVLVGLVEPIMSRYSFHTDTLLFAMVLATFLQLVRVAGQQRRPAPLAREASIEAEPRLVSAPGAAP